jgi:ATP-binding cassette subfamily B protein/subfamily B ATP-binding cassette protein MsbA
VSSSKQRYNQWRVEYKKQAQIPEQRLNEYASGDAPAALAPSDSNGEKTSQQKGEKKSKRSRSAWDLIRSFFGLLRGQWGLVTFSLATVAVAQGLSVIMPLLSQIAIDHVILARPWTGEGSGSAMPSRLSGAIESILPAERSSQLWAFGLISLFVAIIAATIAVPGRYQLTRLVQLTQSRLRRQMFAHMAHLPIHKVQALKSGGLTSLLREDACSVADLIFIGLYNPFKALITFIGGLVMMALIDWRLVLGGIALGPLVYFTHRTWIARIRPVYRAAKQERQRNDGHLTEVFSGIRVMRVYGTQRREARRAAESAHVQSRQTILAWWWSRWIEVVWMVMIPLASAGVLIYGGFAVMEDRLTIGQLTAFTMYLLLLLGPMELLVGTASQLQTALASFDRCLDVLDEPLEFAGSQLARADAPAKPMPVMGPIEIRSLSFHYPGQSTKDAAAGASGSSDESPSAQPAARIWVLRDINLSIPQGATVALVGPSGGGKTTLCNLIARFYDPQQGDICLSNTPLTNLDITAYRRMLSIVEQEVFLFDGTLAENIAYAKRDASMQQIQTAAKRAYAHHFIMQMPRGYDTIIGERGLRLSGGQRQRIAIARALLADPSILILDEATSNLDSESEQAIQQSLEEMMKGRTCFVIAHRLSTIRHADMIVVIESGRIIEVGKHDELMQRTGGRYKAMVRAQVDPHGKEAELA